MRDFTAGENRREQIGVRPRHSLQFGMQPEDCAAMMLALYRDLDHRLQGLERTRVACAAGCAGCCVVNVAVLMPEAIALVEHVRNGLPAECSHALAQRVAAHYGQVRGLNEQQRLSVQAGCAFLSPQGTCLVYPLRPLMCRSVSSTDPADCRAALTAADPEAAPPVLMNLQQKQLCDTAFIELAQAMATLGLDDRSTTLGTAVYHLLQQPGLAAAWLQGGPVPEP